MKYLLYCIFHTSQGHRLPKDLIGVGDQTVFVMAANSLSAAVSRVAPSEMSPDIPRVLAYKNVIDSFHHDRTVIPMRYGCLFEEKSRITRFLKERHNQYHALLKEVDGCVEMGIRVILPDKTHDHDLVGHTDTSDSYSMKESLDIASKAQHPGRTYLAARQVHYAQKKQLFDENSMLIERFRSAFAGLFIKFKTEDNTLRNLQSPIQNPQLFSLYFLIPKNSVELFRKAYERIGITKAEKLLLSGPWPPYNFCVTGSAEPGSHFLPFFNDKIRF